AERAEELQSGEVHQDGRAARDREGSEPQRNFLVPLDVHAPGQTDDSHTIGDVLVQAFHEWLPASPGPAACRQTVVAGAKAVNVFDCNFAPAEPPGNEAAVKWEEETGSPRMVQELNLGIGAAHRRPPPFDPGSVAAVFIRAT